MAVCYERLWELLAKKNMKKIELQHRSGISGNILAKLGRNEYISMQSVEKICGTLNCTIDEIMKFTESKLGVVNGKRIHRSCIKAI